MATLGETSRPAYVYDSGTDTWIPVGIGPHSHDPSAINAVASTTFDAKGDLLAGTGADTYSKLTVGANGLALVADSTASTGLKWQGAVGCSLKNSTTLSVATATYTAVTWNQENYDTDGFHSTVSNTSRVTIPSGKAGKYLLAGFVTFDNNGTGSRRVGIYKNGSLIHAIRFPASTVYPAGNFNVIFDLAVADYVEIYLYQDSGSTQTEFTSDPDAVFCVSYLGA